MDMSPLALVLATAILTCALVAGLLGSFAAIVMPGLARLNDREFLSAFAAIDRVIQRNQPVFVLVWAGSVVSLLAATAIGVATGDGTVVALLLAAAALYVGGVQVPTGAVNVPLNNRLQATDLAAAPPSSVTALRDEFEGRWNRWNRIRSAVALAVVVLLLLANHAA